MNMKGVMHTIEVVIALAMISMALVWLFRPMPTADNTTQLARTGYAALQYLEETGTLRSALASKNTALIQTELQPLLTNFEVEICDTTCTGTQHQGAVALDYFIAGSNDYNPVHMKLYLW